MSETNTQTKSVELSLLEQTVIHHDKDIREMSHRVSKLENEVSDMRTMQQLTTQTVAQTSETLTELKADFKRLDLKLEDNIKEIQKDVQKSNERMFENQIEQLEQYKTTLWKVGGTIAGSIIVAVILYTLGI